MLRIFIDPAMGSTGIFADRDGAKLYFFNPRITFKAGGKLPEKFRNVRIMVARIDATINQILVEGEETEFYVEAPFVGPHSSGLELAGLSFLLMEALLKRIKKTLYGGGRYFLISASMVGGKDRKAKRTRKERKPFAEEAFLALLRDRPDTNVFGREQLGIRAQDDVATAFLFWYYIFGPGQETKEKDRPVLQEVPMNYLENQMTGEDDGSE